VNERVWVNFKELSREAPLRRRTSNYKVEVQAKVSSIMARARFRGHTGSGTAPCFSANLRRGIFHCFGCGAKGNILNSRLSWKESTSRMADALPQGGRNPAGAVLPGRSQQTAQAAACGGRSQSQLRASR